MIGLLSSTEYTAGAQPPASAEGADTQAATSGKVQAQPSLQDWLMVAHISQHDVPQTEAVAGDESADGSERNLLAQALEAANAGTHLTPGDIGHNLVLEALAVAAQRTTTADPCANASHAAALAVDAPSESADDVNAQACTQTMNATKQTHNYAGDNRALPNVEQALPSGNMHMQHVPAKRSKTIKWYKYGRIWRY